MNRNFQKIIKELRRRGYTQHDISKACGLSQSVISRLERVKGAEPRYNAGALLVEMWVMT